MKTTLRAIAAAAGFFALTAGAGARKTSSRTRRSARLLVSVQTGLSFDLSTASGKLMRTIMAGLAKFERDLIRDRVKSGLAAARTGGVKLGRQVGQRPSDKKPSGCPACKPTGKYRLIARNVGVSKNTVMNKRRAMIPRTGQLAGQFGPAQILIPITVLQINSLLQQRSWHLPLRRH